MAMNVIVLTNVLWYRTGLGTTLIMLGITVVAVLFAARSGSAGISFGVAIVAILFTLYVIFPSSYTISFYELIVSLLKILLHLAFGKFPFGDHFIL
jgi:hypothetical protein